MCAAATFGPPRRQRQIENIFEPQSGMMGQALRWTN
jgi:hypothetical protein